MTEVSVVMATYNDKPGLLEDAIESVICQTFVHWELIIVDDSTAGETRTVIDRFTSDSRIRVFRNTERVGFVGSLNEGLRLASGRYVARFDADDLCATDRLEKQFSFLESNPHVDVLGSSIEIIDEDSRKISFRRYPATRSAVLWSSVLRSPLAHPSIMLRKSILDEGYLYDARFRRAEDFELWLRLIRDGKVITNLDSLLLRYRVQSNFIAKRDRSQRQYVFRAQLKNFRWQYFVTSLMGIVVSYIFTMIPQSVFERIYRHENRKG